MTIVAAYGSDPNAAGEGHAHDYLNLNNDIYTSRWECDRDELNYICLVGEWFLMPTIDYVRGDKTKRFDEMIPTLFVASDAWETRRIVEDVVRQEMEQFDVEDATDEETAYLRFLQECFTFMGHLMTGTLQVQYVQRMLNAWERRAGVPPCMLHELLRKQSIELWKAFEKHSLGERIMPLYRLIDETVAFVNNDTGSAPAGPRSAPADRTDAARRMR